MNNTTQQMTAFSKANTKEGASCSGKARENSAIKFLDFFNNYGFRGWYDHQELLLGDCLKDTIVNDGINTAQYGILIIDKTYLNRNLSCEEAKMLYERLKAQKDCAIFPILLDISREEVENSKLNFLLNVKHQFLYTGESIEPIGLQILDRMFHDIVLQVKFRTLDDALLYFKRLSLASSIDIYNTLNVVSNFDIANYKDRTIILICLINLINNNPYQKTIKKISYCIYDSQAISFDMYKIVESIFLICASLLAA